MSWLLIFSNFLAVAIFSVARLRRRGWSLLDPAWAFLLGYTVNYCVRPALFMFDQEVGGVYQDYIYSVFMIQQGVNRAILFSMLGLAGFAIGDLCWTPTAASSSKNLPTIRIPEIIAHRTYGLAALALLVLGCVGLYGFVSAAGWAGTVVELFSGGQRDAFMQVILGHGYYTFAMQLSLVGWAMICVKWITLRGAHGTFRKIGKGLLRTVWFFATLLIWIGLGERASMIAVLFTPVALYLTLTAVNSAADRNKRRRVIACAIVAVLFSVLVAGPIGLLMKDREVTGAAVVAMAISAWDSFEFTVGAQNSIKGKDLFLGRTYISDLVYTWFPRALFPQKPERYGAVLVQDRIAPDLADNIGATFPPGFLVEAYANFWYFGVFFVPMVLAFAFQVLHCRLLENDWFWIIQVVLLFPTIASFRSVGWTAAQLVANLFVLMIILVSCSVFENLSSRLRNLEVLQAAQ